MTEYVGIWRDEEGLTKGIEEIYRLRKESETVKAHGTSQYNPAWSECIDLNAMLTVAEAVARSARMRQESRGAHSRVDFQGEREEWGNYNIIVRRAEDGSMEIERLQRGEDPAELAKIAKATLEDLEAGRV